MPASREPAAACRSPSSASPNSASRFHRKPSGSRTGRFSNRCTTSSATRSPSNRPRTTRPLSAPRSMAAKSVKVEDLGQPREAGVGPVAGRQLEELRHLRLPARVDVGLLHPALRGGEVVGLEVAHEQPVVAQEQRVVAPAGLPQGVEHLGPDGPVPRAVLVQPVRPDAQQEAHTLHQPTRVNGSPSRAATLPTSSATCPTPSATWWVGPSAHQRSKNSAGGAPKRSRLFVFPMRNVSPGIDSPSATRSLSAPSTVCVQPTIVTGP